MTRPRRRAALAGAVAAILQVLPAAQIHADDAHAAPHTPFIHLPLARSPAARSPTAPHAQLLSVDGFWLAVANLERSRAFYRDVLGLRLQPQVRTAADAALQSLTATPGARVSSATLRAASGPSLRLLEFAGVRRRILRPRSVDPGAAMLELRVRNLDAVLSAAARMHVPILTRGATPLALPDGTRRIVLMDPDGFYVSLCEQSGSAASTPPGVPAPAPVASLAMRYTVAAPAIMVRFYQQLFGLTLQPGPFVRTGAWVQLLNQPGAQWALTQTSPAGSLADAEDLREVEFIAFRHVPRHTYSGRPQDPGTPALSLRVSNLNRALGTIRSAGLRVLSAGGQPVALQGGGSAVLFRDPAGLLVELVQR